jgi:hypothetical protein
VDRPAFAAGAWWTGDEDLDWNADDDRGADGVWGTYDPGEADGIPTAGEPDFDRRDADEVDQLGLTGFKMSRLRAGPGSPPTTDNVVFFTDASRWPQRLWEHFTASNPADRFDPALTSLYNMAFLFASGPFKLGVGETQRFSLALAHAYDLDSLRQKIAAAELEHRADYQPLLVDVRSSPAPAPGPPVLLGNRPNPFVRSTTIEFALSAAGTATLEVFDLQGRPVAGRDLGFLAPGRGQATFDAGAVAPGLYFYRLRFSDSSGGAGGASRPGRMVVMK